MVAVSLEQLVRNQLLLREVNERIGEVANAWGGEAPEFLCECSNDDCAETLPVSLPKYKGIRSFPNLFMILPGHEILEVDCIVEEQAGFTLVEKTKHVDLVICSHRFSTFPEED
jgi:hypothetical protein